MIRKVLLAYDGSTSADQALSFAVDLAEKYEAELHVVAVARPPEFAEDVESTAVLEDSLRHYEKVLDRAKTAISGASVNAASFKVVVGTRPNGSFATRRRTGSITSWWGTAGARCSSDG